MSHSLKIALIGDGKGVRALLSAIPNTGHQIVAAAELGASESILRQKFPLVRIGDRHSIVTSLDSESALIVGDVEPESASASNHREDLLREVARQGVPLIITHPGCSAIFALELDMIQQDTQSPILPLDLRALNPLMEKIAGWSKSGKQENAKQESSTSPIGEIEQIVVERQSVDRSRDAVLASMARDGLLLRRFLGDFQRVGALQGPEERENWKNLSVHFSGQDGMLGRWSVGPVVDQPGATLTLVGTQSRAILRAPDEGDWTLQIRADPPMVEPGDSETRLTEWLQASLAGQSLYPNWEDACRALDLADLASESLRRGKTLDVHNERLTEEDTFKSMMAAGGCLLIMLTLPLLFIVVTVEALELPIRNSWLWNTWPLVLLGVLGVFLVLQIFRMAFPKS